jgi:hypothetical protein
MVGIVYRLRYILYVQCCESLLYFHIKVIGCCHNYRFYYVHHFVFVGIEDGTFWNTRLIPLMTISS